MRKINFLQIIIHSLGTLFLIFSFQNFSQLYNFEIVKIFYENGIRNVMNNSEKYGFEIQDFWDITFYSNISQIVGVFSGFVISTILSIKNKWPLLNSFLVLIFTFTMYRVGFLDWLNLQKNISPGQFITDLFLKLLISALFFLTIGFILFFLKKGIIKIDNYSKT